MNPRREAADAGFTLIELMISLGLFALIAVAGLALVDGILRVNGRTEARLDRLAALQRTMFVLSSDLDQLASGPIEGQADRLAFVRSTPGTGGTATQVRYALAGGTLVRAAPAPQLLLPGVVTARWRFWDGDWFDRWPVDASDEAKGRWPRAIALDMQAAGPGGAPVTLHRVVTLPVRAQEAAPQ